MHIRTPPPPPQRGTKMDLETLLVYLAVVAAIAAAIAS